MNGKADVEDKSDESDIILNRSTGSSPGRRLVGSPYKDDHGNKVGSFLSDTKPFYSLKPFEPLALSFLRKLLLMNPVKFAFSLFKS